MRSPVLSCRWKHLLQLMHAATRLPRICSRKLVKLVFQSLRIELEHSRGSSLVRVSQVNKKEDVIRSLSDNEAECLQWAVPC